MTLQQPVALTGLGVVSAAGLGRHAFESTLAGGRTTLTEVDRTDGYHVESSAEKASLVGKLDVRPWISSMAARRMSTPSRFAVVAARMALDDAGLECTAGRESSTAVLLSTAFGATSYSKRLLDQIINEGPHGASAAVFTECVASAPAAQVAIHCRASGPNHTLCGREAGDLAAVGRGAAEIANGRSRRALVGAVDEMPPVIHAVLDRFGALARARGCEPEASRPFDRNRNGFVAGEGSTVLVLESRSEVERRGAEVPVWIRGWHRAFDATASRAGWGRDADLLATGLKRCLNRCGLSVADVDVILSGASGSVAGDRLEALTLRQAWDDAPLPPVVAPKSVTGEYGGGLLAAAVLIVGGAHPGPTAGFVTLDKELGVAPHDGSFLGPVNHALVSCLAAGGAASWLVLERG